MAFGAKIKLTVDSSKPGNFHKEIQSYVDAAASEKNPVYIHSVKLTKNSADSLLNDLRTRLRKDNNLVVKVNDINADQAIQKLRGQLETMLSGLSITGLKEFLGTEGVEQTYDKAAKSAEKAAEAFENVKEKNINANAALKELGNLQSALTTSFNNISKFDKNSNDYKSSFAEYERLNKKLQELRGNENLRTPEAIRDFADEIIGLKQTTTGIIEKTKAAEKLGAELEKINTAVKTSYDKLPQVSGGDKDTVGFQQVQAATKAYNALDVKIKEYEADKSKLTDASIKKLADEAAAFKTLASSITEASKKETAEASKRISLEAQIIRWKQNNGKAYSVYGAQIDGLITSLHTAGTSAKDVRDRFNEISMSAKAIGLTGNKFIDTFAKGLEKFGGWTIVTKSATMVFRKLREVVTNVRELDTAMTELKKVTDASERSYDKFITTAAGISKAAGAKLTDTINATADFARLGYSMDEASSLAEAALIYKNVGDGIDDVSEASESLISTIKAFGIETEDTMKIVDMFNEVGNNFAISSQGVGVALQKSASSLAVAGNSLGESIALITGMNSVVQNPEVVGTALKSLSMYLRAAKTEAEEAGEETDGMASSVSELRDQILTLTKNKVDIMIDSENFKSTYQIMKELAGVWDDLTDVDTANILELIGGKRNATAVTSLLKNFKDAEAALQTTQNSDGSALAENAKQLDSINGKIAVLNANFEEFSNNLLDSDILKWLANVGNLLLSIFNWLSKIKLMIPALTASIIALKSGAESVKLRGLAGTLVASYSGAFEKGKDDDYTLTELGRHYLEQISGLSDHQRVLLASNLKTFESMGLLNEQMKNTMVTTYGLSAAEKLLASTGGVLKSGITSLKNAVVAFGKGMVSAFAANPVGVILTLVSLISTVVSVVKSFHEETIKKGEEAAESIKKITSDLKENEKTVEEVAEKYAKLAQGVDIPNAKNVSLTDDEYKEFLDISKTLSEVFPSLTRVYDENGNAIIQLDGSVNTITNSLKNLLEVQRDLANQEIAGKLEDQYKGAYEQAKEYRKILNNRTDTKVGLQNVLETELQYLEDSKKNLDDYVSSGGTVTISIFDELISHINSSGYALDVKSGTLEKLAEDILSKWDIGSNEHNKALITSAIDELKRIYAEQVNIELNIAEKDINKAERSIKNTYNSLAQSLAAWLYTDSDYKTLSDQAQAAIQHMVNSPDYLDRFKGNFDDLTDALRTEIIAVFSGANGDAVTKAVTDMLSLDPKFQDGTITYNQFVNGIKAFKEKIKSAKLTDEQIDAFEQIFKIDFDSDEISTEYDELVGRVKKRVDAKDLVETLSHDDLMIAANLEVPSDVLLSWDELLEKIREYKELHKEIPKPLSFIGVMSKVEDLSDGLDQLSKIYNDVKDGKEFDWSNILNNKDFYAAFGNLGEPYRDFIEEVSNSSTDIKGCQEAFNSLVGAYINSSGVLNKLTDETRNATVAFFEQNGVVNAAEIVDQALAIQKEKLRVETELGVNATYEEVAAQFNLAEAGSITQQALARVALEKFNLNKTTISSSKDVNNLINIANAARIATSDMQKLVRVKSYWEASESINSSKNLKKEEKRRRLETLKTTYKDIEDIINGTYEYNYQPVSFDDFKYTAPKTDKKDTKDTKKAVDWVETAISKITAAIEKLKAVASDTFSGFSKRIKATGVEIEKVTRLIDIQRQAYNTYMKKAESIDLSDALKEKVRNGAFEITEYNSDVQQKISDFQSWYEKAVACSDEIDTLRDNLNSLYKEQFDLIANSHTSKLGLLEIEAEKLNSQVDRFDEKGFVGTTRYYEALRNIEEKTLKGLREEYTELSEKLNDGTIIKYSESWYDLNSQIEDVAKSISESETALVSFDNKMREVIWDRYDYMQDKLSDFKDESEFYLDLFGDDLYDKDSNELNEKGLAALGLHGLNYDIYISEAKSYAEEIKKINDEIEKSPGDDNLIKRKKELVEAQRDCIKSAQDEKQAMIDLVKDGIQAQIDALKELIDKYTNSLDSAKSLYEYQQNINEQAKNIASLRKQLSAYENDSSDETRAKVQKLKVSLEDAQRELQESQYDRYISDQKELLDSVYEEYQNFLNSRFDNIDKSFEELINKVNVNADVIGETLKSEADKHGVKLSDSMNSVWNSESKALDSYLGGSGIILNGVTGLFDNTTSELSGINNALTGIAEGVNRIVLYASAQAKSDIDPGGARSEMKTNSVNWWAATGAEKDRLSTANNAYGNALGYTKNSNGEWINPSTGKPAYTVTTDDKVRAIIAKMKINSSEWNSASSDRRISLEAQNNSYAQTIASLLGQKVTKDGNGVWWLGNKKLYSYRTGGLVNYTGLAQLDGTPGNPELVLNASDTKNFIELKDILRNMQNKRFLSENILDSTYYNLIKDSISLINHSISEFPRSIRDGAGKSSSLVNNINISIPIERVEDYNDFVKQLSKDKKFERYVQDVVANPITGKNSLGKNKYKW